MVLKVTLHLHVGRLISICIASFHLEPIHDTQSRPAKKPGTSKSPCWYHLGISRLRRTRQIAEKFSKANFLGIYMDLWCFFFAVFFSDSAEDTFLDGLSISSHLLNLLESIPSARYLYWLCKLNCCMIFDLCINSYWDLQADWISLIRPTDGCVRYGIDQVGQAGDMGSFCWDEDGKSTLCSQ